MTDQVFYINLQKYEENINVCNKLSYYPCHPSFLKRLFHHSPFNGRPLIIYLQYFRRFQSNFVFLIHMVPKKYISQVSDAIYVWVQLLSKLLRPVKSIKIDQFKFEVDEVYTVLLLTLFFYSLFR